MTFQEWLGKFEENNSENFLKELSIGDTVRMKTRANCPNYFDDIAMYRGKSKTSSISIALERMNGGRGGAQNGWWNFRIEDIRYLVLVKKSIKSKKFSKKEVQKIFTQLLKHKDVRGVLVDKNQLQISTAPLFFKKTELGRYLICIKHDSTIRIKNLSYNAYYDGIDHPHIRYSEPCFGSYREEINRLFSANSLFLLVDTLIRYLTQGYTPSDSYSSMSDWVANREKIEE